MSDVSLLKGYRGIKFAGQGFKLISVTDGETAGDWIEIIAVDNTAVQFKAQTKASVSGDDFSSNGNYTTGGAMALAAGQSIRGHFDKITVSVGKVIVFTYVESF